MARLKDLKDFSKKHNLKIASIEDLISFRLKNEKLIKNIDAKTINFQNHKLTFLVYKNLIENSLCFVIKKGHFKNRRPIRIRVLSKILKGNTLKIKINRLKNLKILSKFYFNCNTIKDQKFKQKILKKLKLY